MTTKTTTTKTREDKREDATTQHITQHKGDLALLVSLSLVIIFAGGLALLVGDEILLHSSAAVDNDFVHHAHDKRTDDTECKLKDYGQGWC